MQIILGDTTETEINKNTLKGQLKEKNDVGLLLKLMFICHSSASVFVELAF